MTSLRPQNLSDRLPADWRVEDHDFAPDQIAALESVFAVGNGYLGVRGTPEEGGPAHDPGAILNGFHETWPIVYPEDAHGLARTGQTIVSAPDGSVVRLAVDGEPLDLATSRIVRFERVLDLRAGVLRREVEWETSRGRRILVRSSRFASFEDRHLVAVHYEVASLDGPASIAIGSQLVTHAPKDGADDPRRGRALTGKVLLPVYARARDARAVLELVTRNSGQRVACGIDHDFELLPPGAHVETTAAGDGARTLVQADLEAGDSLRLSKYVAYHWTDDEHDAGLGTRVDDTLDRARRTGYDALAVAQRRHVRDFWRRSDVEIEGAPELQRAVRFNLFQLLQASVRSEGLGIPAKGMTGHGYEGHYFWDTEVYVAPFLTHTSPEWARRLLQFRCRMLDAARERARQVGHRGALFPWRTIGGEEASAWYAAGTAQYHINADVAHALHHYNRVTGDLGFMLDCATEVLVETARLWMDLGFFSQSRGGAFCINGVTGPDEYTAVVDNNAFTNLMAKENLEIAVRVIEWLRAKEPEAHAELVYATGLDDAEVDGWRLAAERMYVPRDEDLGIVLQDDGFLEREPWDFEGTPPEKHPLLLHFHPLELYRHQVIKQTDVVLAAYLAGRHLSPDEKRRTFDFYDPLTTGDSTLSACVQSVMASEVGHATSALDYFLDACTVDLLDTHGNTADGIHIASCGGTWMALVNGFGGLRDFDGDVRFQPRLPDGWDRMRFRVQIRGQIVEVDMEPTETTYRLLEGTGLLIEHGDESLRLLPGEPVSRPVEPAVVPVAAAA